MQKLHLVRFALKLSPQRWIETQHFKSLMFIPAVYLIFCSFVRRLAYWTTFEKHTAFGPKGVLNLKEQEELARDGAHDGWDPSIILGLAPSMPAVSSFWRFCGVWFPVEPVGPMELTLVYVMQIHLVVLMCSSHVHSHVHSGYRLLMYTGYRSTLAIVRSHVYSAHVHITIACGYNSMDTRSQARKT